MKSALLILVLVAPLVIGARNSGTGSGTQPKRFVVRDHWDEEDEVETRSRSISGSDSGAWNNGAREDEGRWTNSQSGSGSRRRPDSSSSPNSGPFSGSDSWQNQGSNSRPSSSSSSSFGSSNNRRTTERPYNSNDRNPNNQNNGNRNNNNRNSNNNSERERQPSRGSSSSRRTTTTTTPEPENRGLISGLLGKAKNATSIGAAILTGHKDVISNTIKTFMTTVNSCIGSKTQGWSDPELGNFTVGKNSPYCNKACLRNFFCCPPMRPEELDVKFIFSENKRDHRVLALNDQQSRRMLDRNRNKKIVWIVHGLLNHVYIEPIFNQTRDAYIDRGFNVIIVDWNKGNRLYMQAMANVRIVGALTGQLMGQYGLEERSICAGFSLGSHICGEAGSFLKRHRKTLYKCHGIDPAGPGYDGCSSDIRLDKGDCGIVTAIHTSQFTSLNSLLGEEGLGTKVKSGHCDFWPNDGIEQPKCDNTTVPNFAKWIFSGKLGKVGDEFEHALTCSHWRGMNYYLSQLRKSCHFVGKEGKCGGGTTCSRSNVTLATGRSGRRYPRGAGFSDTGDDGSYGRRDRRPGSSSGYDRDTTGVGDGSFGSGSGQQWGSSSSGSSGSRRPASGSGLGSNGADGWSGSSNSGNRGQGSGTGFGSTSGTRPGYGSGSSGYQPGSGSSSSSAGSGSNGRPGSSGSGGDYEEKNFGSSGSGGRRPGSGLGSSGSGGRPGSSFGSSGNSRPGSSGFGSEDENGSSFGSGSRPGSGFGSSNSRPGSDGDYGSANGFGSSSNNRPGSGSSGSGYRPGSGSGSAFGSGGNRPGSSSGNSGDYGNNSGSGNGNWGTSSSGRPNGQGSGSDRPNRPGSGSSFGNNQGSNEYEEGSGDSGSGGRPNTGGGGRRPGSSSGGNSGGGGGGGSTWTQGQDLKDEMPLSPDDVCDTRYDFDYKFQTTGREPFC